MAKYCFAFGGVKEYVKRMVGTGGAKGGRLEYVSAQAQKKKESLLVGNFTK